MLFGWRRSAGARGAGSDGQRFAEVEAVVLIAEMEGAEPPHVLDVRNPDEYAEGHIPGAQLIPVSELAGRLEEVPRGRLVVCVCRSGHRSGIACRLLTARDYPARNLVGGMLRWHGKVARGASR